MDIPQNRHQVAWQMPGILAALALFLLTFRADPAYAGDLSMPRLIDSQTNGVNLTPAQQQKITALESASRAQSSQFIEQIHQLRHKLSEMYETYNIDAAGVRRTNQEINHVQSQLLDLRLLEQIQMRKILSPAQFAQLQAAIQKNDSSEGDRHPEPDDRHGHRR